MSLPYLKVTLGQPNNKKTRKKTDKVVLKLVRMFQILLSVDVITVSP